MEYFDTHVPKFIKDHGQIFYKDKIIKSNNTIDTTPAKIDFKSRRNFVSSFTLYKISITYVSINIKKTVIYITIAVNIYCICNNLALLTTISLL